MIKSLELLSRLDVKILYPGHGEVTDDDVNREIKESLISVKLLH
jgi:glyoxylase-like metal-dependent hydrolase (beta-lactamase superfamily II)